MDLLRKIINWLWSHRFISLIGTLLIVILIIFVRTIITRSDGTLSGPLHRGAAVDAVYGIGTVTALRSYSFRPGVTSTIYNLYVKEGDTGSLDTVNAEIVMNILRDCSLKQGMTVIMVTHDPDFSKMAPRQIRLADGKIVSDEKEAK